eukprot:scaffold53888_cov38-Tisochrysis_lutea.AAC.1
MKRWPRMAHVMTTWVANTPTESAPIPASRGRRAIWSEHDKTIQRAHCKSVSAIGRSLGSASTRCAIACSHERGRRRMASARRPKRSESASCTALRW